MTIEKMGGRCTHSSLEKGGGLRWGWQFGLSDDRRYTRGAPGRGKRCRMRFIS